MSFCRLHRTNLGSLLLFKVDLSYFDLSYSNLSNATLMNVDFNGTRLDRINVSGITFVNPTGCIEPPIRRPFHLKGSPPTGMKILPHGLNPEEMLAIPVDVDL